MAARKTPAATTDTAPKPRAKPGPKPGAKRAPRAATASKATTAKAAAPKTTRARRAATRVPTVSASTAWSLGAVLVAAGAGLAAWFTRGAIANAVAKATGTAEGHVPTDLLDPNRNADDRAVADFRPDMDAVMTAAEREALRPPVGKPSMTASNGSMNAVGAPLN